MPEKIIRDISVKGEVKIPVELLAKYKVEPRFVIRHPWIIGIPVPEFLLDAKLREALKEANMDVFMTPRNM